MASTRRIPLAALVELCRALRHGLGAGLSLVAVLRQQAERGPGAIQALAGELARDLGKGHDLERALEKHRDCFPPLFVEMAIAGEQSGGLPEVFEELEKHFRLVQKLRRQFRSQLTWPVLELIVGVGVVALLLLVLGALKAPLDPLGIGTGPRGALIFVAMVGAPIGLLLLAFQVLRRRSGVEKWLLRRPVVGPCLMALALHRFSVALRLTSATGMPIAKAVRLALRATGNTSFVAAEDPIARALQKGEELNRALARGKVFPREYLDVLSGAELAGRLDDVLEHQSEFYQEEAERRLSALTTALGYGIWFLIGVLLIFLIFRLAMTYFNAINQFV